MELADNGGLCKGVSFKKWKVQYQKYNTCI